MVLLAEPCYEKTWKWMKNDLENDLEKPGKTWSGTLPGEWGPCNPLALLISPFLAPPKDMVYFIALAETISLIF